MQDSEYKVGMKTKRITYGRVILWLCYCAYNSIELLLCGLLILILPYYFNCSPLEVVSRHRDPQLKVGIFRSFRSQYQKFDRQIKSIKTTKVVIIGLTLIARGPSLNVRI